MSISNYTSVVAAIISVINIQNINRNDRPRWEIIMDPPKIIRKTFAVDGKTTFALLIIVIAIALIPLLAYCIMGLCTVEWTCCSRRWRERRDGIVVGGTV